MSEPLICEEIPQYGKTPEPHRLHEIAAPGRDDPGWYQTIEALNAFQTGRRKGASAVDKEFHRDSCCWGPNSLFMLSTKTDWTQLQERIDRASRKTGGEGDMLAQFEGGEDPSVTTLEQVPRTHHASLKAFFEHIGFDPKSRRYRDKEGKPIQFSTLDPKKNRQAPQTPGI